MIIHKTQSAADGGSISLLFSVEDENGDTFVDICGSPDSCAQAFDVKFTKNDEIEGKVLSTQRFKETQQGFGTVLLLDSSGSMVDYWDSGTVGQCIDRGSMWR